MTTDPAKWLYDLHNKVNNKLRIQCKDDPKVICPDDDPSFEEVKIKYQAMKLTEVPGRDFLFSVAVNYPDEPQEEDMALQRMFMSKLSEVYPFEKLQTTFKKYLQLNPVLLSSRTEYMKWMYRLLRELAGKVPVKIPSYKGYVQHVMYYKSGCAKKTYRGVTCRKTMSGGRTKKRDNMITKRISHKKLLQSPFSFVAGIDQDN